jgi:ferredoxin
LARHGCRGRGGRNLRERRGHGRGGRGERCHRNPGVAPASVPRTAIPGPTRELPPPNAPDFREATRAEGEAGCARSPSETIRPPRDEAESRSVRRVAVIDYAACRQCGLCGDSCPQDAIRLTDRVEVDGGRCTGCGACVDACPVGAIQLESTSPG